jgi:cyanophycinase
LDPDGIGGKLVIVGGGDIPPPAMSRFVEWAGGAMSRLVIVTTADARAGEESFHHEQQCQWQQRTGGEVHVLHAATRDEADSAEFIAPLAQATAVWFEGGLQARLADQYLNTAVEQQLYALAERGGVIGGTSAGAAIMSRVMIASGNPEPLIREGFDLLPDAIIDQHFQQRGRQPRLARALSLHPDRFGIGLDENTAILLKGREIDIVGQGAVTFQTGDTETHAARQWQAQAPTRADLTAWRRAARQTAGYPFPPFPMNPPQLESGSLVTVGGGNLQQEILKRFIELAGGPDALIVILPTAIPDPLPSDESLATTFLAAGATNVKVLRPRRQEELETPDNLELLRDAKAIWFGGGRQWRFVDAYEGTAVLPLLHDVLQHGGVIGGSSAGASIQAEYMVRGNPLGNTDMMAVGYERGFGFLPGAAIDQHFTQRNRFEDLLGVIRTYPQLLGIGIDEGTALIVSGAQGEVIGAGAVHICGGTGLDAEESDSVWTHVPAGKRFHLVQRRLLEN